MKKLPRMEGTMEQLDWVPMDVAGATLVDVATAPASESVHIYHLPNSHHRSWSEIYPVIESYYRKTSVEIEIIAYDDEVLELGRIQENVEHMPGLKLFFIYQNLRSGTGITLPRLSTEEAADVSLILQGARVVDENDIRRWSKQWVF